MKNLRETVYLFKFLFPSENKEKFKNISNIVTTHVENEKEKDHDKMESIFVNEEKIIQKTAKKVINLPLNMKKLEENRRIDDESLKQKLNLSLHYGGINKKNNKNKNSSSLVNIQIDLKEKYDKDDNEENLQDEDEEREEELEEEIEKEEDEREKEEKLKRKLEKEGEISEKGKKKFKNLNLNSCFPLYDSENLKYSDILKNVIIHFNFI